ncbi:MAG: M15 family metallopeptidase [Bacteroidota bacterium]
MKKKSIGFWGSLALCFLLLACSDSEVKTIKPLKQAVATKEKPSVHAALSPKQDSLVLDLVALEDVIPEIHTDLKYASFDNFMQQKLYVLWKKAYVQKPIADQLKKAQKRLHELNPTLYLLVYDAARPVEIQRKMWFALDSIPPKERGKFVSSPYNKSLHNYGCAVDLTLCNDQGIPLDMGASFDDIRKIAYPSMENYYLSTGEITREQVANRKLLRIVMRFAGFTGLGTEWWHFNGCSKQYAQQHFKVIEREEDAINK